MKTLQHEVGGLSVTLHLDESSKAEMLQRLQDYLIGLHQLLDRADDAPDLRVNTKHLAPLLDWPAMLVQALKGM